jgi:phosphate:Na+ symporter
VVFVTSKMSGGGRRVAIGNLVFKAVGCLVFSLSLPLVLNFIARFDEDARRRLNLDHIRTASRMIFDRIGCSPAA